MISSSPQLLAEIHGAVGHITFNNPERRNALTREMCMALPAVLDHFEKDPLVRVILVKGAGGKAFISGADISRFESGDAPGKSGDWEKAMADSLARLRDTPKPTIAMIQGACMGGGLMVALDCDFRLATEDARFGIPAARLGLGYPWHAIKRVMDVIGTVHARDVLLTGRQIDAPEAYRMGLINRVVRDADLEKVTATLCQTIAENAPLTMAAIKVAMQELTRVDGEMDLRRCDEAVAACVTSADYVEGPKAFLEKRKPVFQGR